MNHPLGHEGVILAMIHDGQIKHLCIFTGTAHEFVILNAMAVVGDGDDAGALERTDGCELFARDILGDRSGDEQIYESIPFRPVVNERHRARIINRR